MARNSIPAFSLAILLTLSPNELRGQSPQFGEFARDSFHTDLVRTESLAFADLDGDGDLDLSRGAADRFRIYSNLQTQAHADQPPRIGQGYRLDVYARYPARPQLTVALPSVALAPASVPIPSLGTLGLDPVSMVALQPFVVPQPAGIGSATIPVPNDPTLAGLEVFGQALVLRAPGAPGLTNVVRSVVR